MIIKAVGSAIAGWFIPGLGHILQKKYTKGLIFFACICAMSGLGLIMGGKLYIFQTENPLTILAFLSDLGFGSLMLLSKLIALGAGSLESPTFEFGTAYIAGAGLLNYLIALDAFDIASKKKD